MPGKVAARFFPYVHACGRDSEVDCPVPLRGRKVRGPSSLQTAHDTVCCDRSIPNSDSLVYVLASRFHVIGTSCCEKFSSFSREKVTTSLVVRISGECFSS